FPRILEFVKLVAVESNFLPLFLWGLPSQGFCIPPRRRNGSARRRKGRSINTERTEFQNTSRLVRDRASLSKPTSFKPETDHFRMPGDASLHPDPPGTGGPAPEIPLVFFRHFLHRCGIFYAISERKGLEKLPGHQGLRRNR